MSEIGIYLYFVCQDGFDSLTVGDGYDSRDADAERRARAEYATEPDELELWHREKDDYLLLCLKLNSKRTHTNGGMERAGVIFFHTLVLRDPLLILSAKSKIADPPDFPRSLFARIYKTEPCNLFNKVDSLVAQLMNVDAANAKKFLQRRHANRQVVERCLVAELGQDSTSGGDDLNILGGDQSRQGATLSSLENDGSLQSMDDQAMEREQSERELPVLVTARIDSDLAEIHRLLQETISTTHSNTRSIKWLISLTVLFGVCFVLALFLSFRNRPLIGPPPISLPNPVSPDRPVDAALGPALSATTIRQPAIDGGADVHRVANRTDAAVGATTRPSSRDAGARHRRTATPRPAVVPTVVARPPTPAAPGLSPFAGPSPNQNPIQVAPVAAPSVPGIDSAESIIPRRVVAPPPPQGALPTNPPAMVPRIR